MDSLILGKTQKGKSVFANRDIKKGEEIFEFIGKRYTYDELPSHNKEGEDHFFQIGKKLYIGPSGDYDDFINHSCNPNTGHFFKKKKIILTAIRDIKKGEEIFWDYSTTMDEDEWEMDCLCGQKNCRKRIRDFKYLPKKVQDKYIKLGIVPKYIIDGLKEL